MSDTNNLAQNSIAVGSKSFSLASKIFPKDLRQDAEHVYFWCRYCDDQIDEGGDFKKLEYLRQSTLSIWQDASEFSAPPFEALAKVVLKRQIPSHYPLELLEGMRMDLLNTHYQTFTQLKLYCYRVASTVGLMMCHVMGLTRETALQEAADLGVAMQLTNIARDIKEDFELGRTYLPLEWLEDVGLDKNNYMHPENRDKLFKVVQRLIGMADSYYQKGLKGLDALNWRCAFTILCAAKIYREIGRQILTIGVKSVEKRVVVSKWRKYYLISEALIEMIIKLPKFMKPKNKVVIANEWRHL